MTPKGWLYRPALEQLARKTGKWTTVDEYQREYQQSLRRKQLTQDAQKVYDWITLYLEDKELVRTAFTRYAEQNRYYIPMLRGMRPPAPINAALDAEQDGRDTYELRTHQDYFSQAGWPTEEAGVKPASIGAGYQKRPRIFTGLGIYADMQRRLLSPIQSERDSIRASEIFLSQQFFSGVPVTLTPALHKGDAGKRSVNDVVYLKIGDSKDHPIYDLGDGMQSLIICTYPIITELSDGALFFLEEPDLCMHPSLQRIFLNVLRHYHHEKGHQFFLTTHSNHLLDLLEDDQLVSIFSFSSVESAESNSSGGTPMPSEEAEQPTNQFRIRHASQRDRNTLLELGVRPSATYLANATIWVEGTSDCSYLRAYLEGFIAYLELRGDETYKAVARDLKRYREDRHYAFLEYNGANLVHFDFDEAEDPNDSARQSVKINANDLCAQALVIADGDIASKADRVQALTKQLGDRLVLLPVKEIENLIPEAALRRQVEADRHSKQNKDTWSWPADHNKLSYVNYSVRLNASKGNQHGESHGLGNRLARYKFTGYEDKSGTLKQSDKNRWASRDNGIPKHVREMICDYSNDQAGEGVPEVPTFLNQDLIWLCLSILYHIARHNHDDYVTDNLDRFKGWILQDGASNAWPIQHPSCANSRTCLLTQFLRSS
ncbi:ATP-binding protein [Cyanobium sp. FGCU-52]|nr:ATP-binding protein [Cyanobium sp. FGCU52]